MQPYHTTLQTYFVTEVIESNRFEIAPGISREVDLKTPVRAPIEAAVASIGTVKGAFVIPTFTEESDDSNVFHTIRLKNLYVPESETSEGQKAIHYLKQLIEEKRVIFNFDPRSISDDPSDPHIGAYVWRFSDKAFVNALMVYSGHAEWGSPPPDMPLCRPPRVSRIRLSE